MYLRRRYFYIFTYLVSSLFFCTACDDQNTSSVNRTDVETLAGEDCSEEPCPAESNDMMIDINQECQGENCDPVCEPGYVMYLRECVVDVDQDRDRDGVPDAGDNCPNYANADQVDCDQDGLGDVCDEESICLTYLSGFVSQYDPNIGEDVSLANALLEVEGQPLYTLTNAEGQYRLGPISEGAYHLLFFAPEASIEREPQLLARLPFSITATSQNASQQQDWIIDPPGDIVGGVKYADKQPFNAVHEGIGVYIEDLPFFKTITDIGGRFEFRNVPAGEHRLRFVFPDYEPTEINVEVVGLATVNVSGDQNTFIYPEISSSMWEHRLEVRLSGFTTMDQGRFQVDVEPLFPHHYNEQSQPFIFENVIDDDLTGEIAVNTESAHRPFEVFHLNFADSVKRTSLYNIGASNDDTPVFSSLYSEGLPQSWESYDELLVSSQYDLPEPEVCIAQELEITDFQALPITMNNSQGDSWTIMSLSSNHPEYTTLNVRPDYLKSPFGHQHREVSLSLTRNVIASFAESNENTTIIPEPTRYDFSFKLLTESASNQISVAMSAEPCWPGAEPCEIQKLTLNLIDDCSLEGNEWLCNGSLSFDSAYPQLRFWVYFEEQGSDIPLLEMTNGFPTQCLNRFTAAQELRREAYIPIYPFISRDIRGAFVDFSNNSDPNNEQFELVNRFGLSLKVDTSPPLCTPEVGNNDMNNFPFLEESLSAVENQLPQPGYGLNGKPLVIQKLKVGSAALAEAQIPADNLALVSGILGSSEANFVLEPLLDRLNPLIYFNLNNAQRLCQGGACEFPIPIYYEATDGANVYKRIIMLNFMDRGNDLYRINCQIYDYCWRFTDRDICCNPYDVVSGGSCF